MLSYAETMGRNTAGFMNEKLANHLWSHRQDFALSAEICDEAFYDVRANLAREEWAERFWHTRQTKESYGLLRRIAEDTVKYYGQFFLFASNMKVIEDAYILLREPVQERYQDRLIESFLQGVDDRAVVLEKLLLWGDRLFGESGELGTILGGRAENIVKGFEAYILDVKDRLRRCQ